MTNKRNIVIITSVICPPQAFLSYTRTRSVFSPAQRYEQTLNSIRSVRKHIPNSWVILVECSLLNDQWENTLKTLTNKFVNLHKQDDLRQQVHSPFKALGEITQTKHALAFVTLENVEHIFKLSGRYSINDNFKWSTFAQGKTVVKPIFGSRDNVLTAFYKIAPTDIDPFKRFLEESTSLCLRGIGYEVMFATFAKTVQAVYVEETLGIEGTISVSGEQWSI